MLVIKAKDGVPVAVTHGKTGDVLTIRPYHVDGRLRLAFEDDALNFDIQREDRETKTSPVQVFGRAVAEAG